MTEFMISAGISAVIAGVLVYAIFWGRDKIRFEKMKAEILEHHKVVVNQLKKDLDLAVKVTGYSNYTVDSGTPMGFMGIARINPASGAIAGDRANPTDNDALMILAEREGHFFRPLYNNQAVPYGVGRNSGVPNEHYFIVSFLTGADPIINNLVNYIHSGISTHYLFSLSNTKATNIVQRTNLVQDATQSLDKVHFYSANYAESEFKQGAEGLSTQVRLVHRIEYQIQDGKLIRSQFYKNDRTAPEGTPKVVSDMVSEFRTNFRFRGDRVANPTTGELAIAANIPLSHPRDSQFMCGVGSITPCCPLGSDDKCADWRDLSSVAGEIVYISKSKLPSSLLADNSTLQENGMVFFRAGDKLGIRTTFSVSPIGFGNLQTSDLERADDPFCTPSNVNARCQQQCSNIFDGSTAERARMYGDYYGIENVDPSRHESNYCRCGRLANNTQRVPEQLVARNEVPVYSTEPARALACLATFGVCSEYSWRTSTWPAVMVCECLHAEDRDNYHSAGDGDIFNLAAFDAMAGSAGSHADEFQCTRYMYCQNVAGFTGSSTLSNAYRAKCECVTHEPDDNGISTSAPVTEPNWAKICDPDPTNGCPALYSGTAPNGRPNYKMLEDPPHDQGFSQDQAGVCECYKTKAPSASIGDPYTDFRTDNLGGGPPPPAGASTKWASITSESVDVSSTAGSFTKSCDVAQCSTLGNTLGCCTAQPMTPVIPTAVDQFGVVVDPLYVDRQGYCRMTCVSNQLVNGENEVTSVKRNIFSRYLSSTIPDPSLRFLPANTPIANTINLPQECPVPQYYGNWGGSGYPY